jgi:hypothetical protein
MSLADEPWEGFCGTMRFFVRLYKLPPPVVDPGTAQQVSEG